MRSVSHMPARQIYSVKVPSPELRIIYLGSQILNWSLRPVLPAGNTAVLMEQRCDLLVMLKVRTMTLSKQREPSMNQKGPEKETLCILHQFVARKRKYLFCFLPYKPFCWQHCQLRLCVPTDSFLFTPLQLSCLGLGNQFALQTDQKMQLILSWISSPIQFTSSPHKQLHWCYLHRGRNTEGGAESTLPQPGLPMKAMRTKSWV